MRLREDLELRDTIQKKEVTLFQEERIVEHKAKENISKIQEENRRTYN